jgi:poly(3-hydroxybutyrate) depolymerase
LLSVEGELDDISGSGQTSAVHEICTGVPKSNQRHFEAKGAGHYGIFAGRRWREHVYPVVKAFILANTPKAPAVAKTVPIASHQAVAAPAKADAIAVPAKAIAAPAKAIAEPAAVTRKPMVAKKAPAKKVAAPLKQVAAPAKKAIAKRPSLKK